MSQPPQPGRIFENATIRITDLTVVTDVLEGIVFRNCLILGPAVLMFLENVRISDSSFDSDGADDLFWPFAPERIRAMGTVTLKDVSFLGCRFERIGLAVPEGAVADLTRGFGP